LKLHGAKQTQSSTAVLRLLLPTPLPHGTLTLRLLPPTPLTWNPNPIQLDELLEAARRKARTELSRNTEAAAAITAELNRLEALLSPIVQETITLDAFGHPVVSRLGAPH
jgi:hypothetical protein